MALKWAIKKAKRGYSARLERDSGTKDSAVVWSTLRTITNYKRKSPVIIHSPGLADDLNTFYTRFERPYIPHCLHSPAPLPPLTKAL